MRAKDLKQHIRKPEITFTFDKFGGVLYLCLDKEFKTQCEAKEFADLVTRAQISKLLKK